MLTECNLTDARKNFSSLYDQVFNTFKPAVVKRKKTEEILLLRVDLQKMLLSQFRLKPNIMVENDNSITLTIDELEIYANANSMEEAIEALINDLKEYAQDYIQRSQLFLHSPNRRAHFPYVLRIMLCNNDDEIKELLEL